MNFIISGASRGLGKSFAKYASKFGGTVGIIAKNNETLKQVASELDGCNVITYACDFTDPNSVDALVEELNSDFKTIDVLVNNVGSFETGNLENSDLNQVDRMLNINFKAAFSITQRLLYKFKLQKTGFIFNIGSIVTEIPRKDISAYTISKFALKGYTKVLCDDLKDFDVKVTEIIPGSINTSSWDGIEAPKMDFVQPEDIVRAAEMVLNSSKGANFEEIIVRPTDRNF
jgi:short-subunit dehydrogenase